MGSPRLRYWKKELIDMWICLFPSLFLLLSFLLYLFSLLTLESLVFVPFLISSLGQDYLSCASSSCSHVPAQFSGWMKNEAWMASSIDAPGNTATLVQPHSIAIIACQDYIKTRSRSIKDFVYESVNKNRIILSHLLKKKAIDTFSYAAHNLHIFVNILFYLY